MKKNRFTIPAIFMIVLTVTICTYGQDSAEVVILSPKVGEAIDSSEREYYHVFPAVKDFNSAVIVKLPNGKYEGRFSVGSSTAQKTISIEMSEMLIYSLAEKIEYFEELKKGLYVMGSHRPSVQIGGVPAEWKLDHRASRSDADTRGETIKEIDEKAKVIVMTRSKAQYYGSILCVADSALVVWMSIEPYDCERLSQYAVAVPSQKIDRILLKKESKFVEGLGTGFLCGGALGAAIGFASGDDRGGLFSISAGGKALLGGLALGLCGAIIGGGIGAAQGIDKEYIVEGNSKRYWALVPLLRENAILAWMPTSQLHMLFKQASEEPSPPIQSASVRKNEPSSEPSPSKFHLFLSGAWISTSANNDIIGAFNSSGFGGRVENWLFGGWIDYPKDYSKSFSWSVGLECNLSDRIRSGFALSSIPKQEIHGMNGQYECADGRSYHLLLEYVFEPSPWSQSEFAVAAGPSYNALSVNGALFGPFYSSPTNFTMNKSIVGIYARVSYDYYTSKDASFQFKVEGRLVPGVRIPETSCTDTVGASQIAIMTLKQHTIDFSEIGFSFGVRFHF